MSNLLPEDHDVIILGTGMTECILAGALARIGIKVLHLDKNDFYGGDWASFNFKSLIQWISNKNKSSFQYIECKEENNINIPKNHLNIYDLETLCPYDMTQIYSILEANESIFNPLNPGIKVCKFDKINEKQDINNETIISNRNNLAKNAFDKKENLSNDNIFKDEIVNSVDHHVSYKISDNILNENDTGDIHKYETLNNIFYSNDLNVLQNIKESNEIINEKQFDTNIMDSKINALVSNWRKFNIDLLPKILFSRGKMVDLLLSSDVARYCEFKSVTRVLTQIDGKFKKVPCSRSDVFSSCQLSMLEKRMLMKFLTFAIDYDSKPDEYIGFEEKPFSDFLKSKSLSDSICHYLHYSIAMVPKNATTIEGLVSTQRFLKSMNRYGTMPFLWPMYGTGELLQCFCRLCAVFGGIYCLNHSLKSFIINENNCVSSVIDSDNQQLNTNWLVLESSSTPSKFLTKSFTTRKISRAILITDRSLFIEKDMHISVAVLPSNFNEGNIIIYELCHTTFTVPQDFFLVHLTCFGNSTAKVDFCQLIADLFQPISKKFNENEIDFRPQILWALFFTVDEANFDIKTSINNLLVVPGPDFNLDFDASIEHAQKLFKIICPEGEFLPKAPNPDDIIFND